MVYIEDYVLPLEEVYAFQKAIVGQFPAFDDAISALRRRGVYPQQLWRAGGYSEVRRILCYLALQKCDDLWNRFVPLHWPTANGKDGQEIIRDLEDYFIHSRLLATCKGRLLP